MSPVAPDPVFASSADRLRAALAARRATIDALDALAAGQEEILAGGDTGRIRALLAARQTLVDRLVAGQPEFLALTADLEATLAALPADDAEELRRGLAAFAEGLARVGSQSDRAVAAVRVARGEAA